MSYILDALKKSDQQRQRGATPTLQAAQITVAAPQRPLLVYYGLLAAVLIGAGIMIGWLHPWQPEQTPIEAEALAVESPLSISQPPAPLVAPSEMLGRTAQEFAAPTSTPSGQAVSVADAMRPSKSAPSAATSIPDESASVAQEQEAIPLNELPLPIQQEIPAMEVQLHAYSNEPGERLVSINSIRLREGGSLMLGLRLEQITPDGMIFSYKGYRFQRGTR